MEVKIEDMKKGKFKLTISVPPKEMAVYFKKSYEKIAPTIKLDGFRPGKAPRKLVEGAAGINRILSEGLDLAVNESYAMAVRDNKLIPLSSPNIVINKYPNYGQEEDEVKEVFEYEAELEVLPEVKLSDYSKEKVDKGNEKKATGEDVEKVLAHFQKQSAKFNDVNRLTKKGDRVEISFEGSIKHVKIDQMCSKNHPLILGENTLIPGFEDNLIGMKKGDKKEFSIKFPKDYHSKDFAGKDALFKVELIDAKEMELPKIDGEFAERFGHKTVNELKKAIEKNLNDELKVEYQRELEAKVLEKILPHLQVDVPETLINREVDRMISDFETQVSSQGINFDQYLVGMKKSREDIKKEMQPQALKNVKTGLLLGKIIDEQKWDHHDPAIGKKAIEYLVEKLAK